MFFEGEIEEPTVFNLWLAVSELVWLQSKE
jgi:hypothetical protein